MPTHSTGHHITIRPNHRDNKEISFLWSPGIVIAELAFRPKKGLGFLIREGGTVKFAEPSLVQNSFSPISFWTGSERPEHPPPDRLATGSPHSAMFEQLSWLGSRLRASWRPGQDACTVADLVF